MAPANPMLVKWIEDLRDRHDIDSNPYKSYNKAVASMKKYQVVISDPREAINVKFVGQKTVDQLTKRWEAHARGEEYEAPAPSKRGKMKSFTIDEDDLPSDLAGNPFLNPDASRAAPAPKNRARPAKRSQANHDSDVENAPPPKRRSPPAMHQPIRYNAGPPNVLPPNNAPVGGDIRSQCPFFYLDNDNNRVSNHTRAYVDYNPPFVLHKVEIPVSQPVGALFRLMELDGLPPWTRKGTRVAWIEDHDINRLGIEICTGIPNTIGFADPMGNPVPNLPRASISTPVTPVAQPLAAQTKDDLASVLAQEKKNKIRTLDSSRTLLSRTDAALPQDGAPPRQKSNSMNMERKDSGQSLNDLDFNADPVAMRRAAAEAAVRRQGQNAPPVPSKDPKGKGKAVESHPASPPASSQFSDSSPYIPKRSSQAGSSRTASMPEVPLHRGPSAASFQPPPPPRSQRTASAPAGPSGRKVAPRLSSHRPAPAPVDEAEREYAQFDIAPTFARFVPQTISAGMYDIILLLDNREVKSQKNRDYIRDELLKKNISVEQRALAVGDICWIAKSYNGTEYVLDWIVERKRLDDLVGSIKDNRFHEQKFRLSQSGLSQVHYIVEAYNQEEIRKANEKMLQTALSSTQIVDGFYVMETDNLRDTINHLHILHRLINKRLEGRDLHIIPQYMIRRHSYLALQKHLRETQPSTAFYTTYDDHKDLNAKSGSLTVGDSWMKMLLCISGCSAEKVRTITEYFPTPVELYDAFLSAKEREDEGLKIEREAGGPVIEKGKRKAKSMVPLAKYMLTELGGTGRKKIGQALSEKIYAVMMAEVYAT